MKTPNLDSAMLAAKSFMQMESQEITITGYETSDYSRSIGTWKHEYIPEQVSLGYKNNFSSGKEATPIGEQQAERTFKQSPAAVLSLDLEILKPYVDLNSVSSDFMAIGSGNFSAANSLAKLSEKYVQDKLDKLKKLVSDYNGKVHAPNFIKIEFGVVQFKGRCDSFDYTLEEFDKSGNPWKASVKMSFSEEISVIEQKKIANASSPDMTHYYVVEQGETLTAISKRIYGTTNLYLELARVNKLNSFRSIPAGTNLILPPLESK